MRAAKEVSLKIGLIAGQGAVPELLVSKWERDGLTPVIVGLAGITNPNLYQNRIAAEFKIGQAGSILNFLKNNGAEKLVMVGALKRPNFWTILPDMGGVSILFKLLMRRRGDDSLLRFIRSEIERYGLTVVGAHEYLPEILCPQGVLGNITPTDDDYKMIITGIDAAKQHGAADKGQSVIVTVDGVQAVETVAGTNALIDSNAHLKNAILVKTSKPQQDLALDMPTIGLATIHHLLKAGMKGVALEARKTMIIDQDAVVTLCNEHKIFIVGI